MTSGSASTSTAGSGRPLLVFDGDCGFCTTSARAAQRWLKLEHVEPWQFLDLDAIGITEAACTAAVQWVAVDGTVSAGEKAASAALRHAGGVWGVLGRLMELPGIRHLAGVVYRLIARYRYKLPGGTPACRLPPG
jgi:predicted DCC family thiol-disulfide oxidoreductase YuxK